MRLERRRFARLRSRLLNLPASDGSAAGFGFTAARGFGGFQPESASPDPPLGPAAAPGPARPQAGRPRCGPDGPAAIVTRAARRLAQLLDEVVLREPGAGQLLEQLPPLPLDVLVLGGVDGGVCLLGLVPS